jgi:membrane protease YdiL (CAAX protease family)
MFVISRGLKNVNKAIFVQSIVFGLSHLHGFDFWELVDIFSIIIMGLGFSYTAFKTNSLIPGIIFHFLHDGFIFLVQTPDAAYNGTFENVVFFLSLWMMVGIGCLITKVVVEKGNISQKTILYDLSKVEY